MTTSSLLFGAAMTIVLALCVSRPIRERVVGLRGGQRVSERQQLMSHKAAIYAAIREIDTDVQVGKLEPADHRALRARYVSEAVSVLRALDEESDRDPIDSVIEDDINRLREGGRVTTPIATPGDRFCGTCGAAADPSDRFCARCGADLTE